MPTAPNRPNDDAEASWHAALGYRAREGVLAAVALLMVIALILVDGRPRVTFAFFGLLSVALIVNLERQRRRSTDDEHQIDNHT